MEMKNILKTEQAAYILWDRFTEIGGKNEGRAKPVVFFFL